jgi:cysteine synthase A
MKGAIAKAQHMVKETPNAWMPAQFDNPANVEVHKKTTAIEVFEATEGRLDAFVAGVGTGGSVTGTGTVLKEKIPGIRIVAVESADSPVLSGQPPVRPNRIQGISAGFVPAIYDKKVVDKVIPVPYETAIETSRRLCREEGIFVGISAGAVCHAALEVAKELGAKKRVVALLPDLGERYLTHELFAGIDTTNRIIDATKEDLPAPTSTAAPA